MTQSEIRNAAATVSALSIASATPAPKQFEIQEVASVEATGRGLLYARGALTAAGWILLAMAAC